MEEMFVDGYFIGTVLLCAAIAEIILPNQLMSHGVTSNDEIKQLTFEEISILASRSGIITTEEKNKIDELRQLRNALIHVNVGKLGKRIKLNSGDPFNGMEPELYLSSISDEEGISADASKYLRFTRDLIFRFYGAKE